MNAIDPESEADLLIGVRIILANLAWPVAVSTLLVAAVAVWAAFQTPLYSAKAQLMPAAQAESPALGQLAGLASSFGLGGGGGMGTIDVLEDVLMSRNFAGRLINKKVPADSGEVHFLQAVGKSASDSEQAVSQLHSWMRKHTKWAPNKNNVILVEFEALGPDLARAFLQVILDELRLYNREERTMKATSERIFVEERMKEADSLLALAEARLESFSMKNQSISSPVIAGKMKTLHRDVRVREESFLVLTQQFELARIQEEKERPFVEVLDPPFAEAEPVFPKTVPILVGTALFGLVIGMLGVLLLHGISLRWKRVPGIRLVR